MNGAVVWTKAFWIAAVEAALVAALGAFLGSLSATGGTVTTQNLYSAAWGALIGAGYSIQKSLQQTQTVNAMKKLGSLEAPHYGNGSPDRPEQ